MTTVFGSARIDLIKVCLPFLCGGNPRNTNDERSEPELTKAGTNAVAPGKQSIWIPYSKHLDLTKDLEEHEKS